MTDWKCEEDLGFCHATSIQTVALGIAVGAFSFIMAFCMLLELHIEPFLDDISKKAKHVKQGLRTFLVAEYAYLIGFSLIVWIILVVFYGALPPSGDSSDSIRIGACFLAGLIASGAAGYSGLNICVEANIRVTRMAKNGINVRKVLGIVLCGGSVLAFIATSFAVFGISFLFYLMTMGRDISLDETRNNIFASEAIVGFGLGASIVALVSRVSGGVFASAANIAHDIFKQSDTSIGDDDLKNPLLFSKMIGVSTSGGLGMAADLCQSFAGAIIAAAIMAEGDTVLVAVPFWIAGSGTLASMIGCCLIDSSDTNATQKELVWSYRKGVICSSLFTAVLSAVIVFFFFENHEYGWRILGCIVIGIVAGILIDLTTGIFTSSQCRSVKSITASGVTGPATVVIQGLGIGMVSCVAPVLILFVTILACYILAGQYGITISAVGMTSTFGLTIGINAMQCIADNVKSLAKIAELGDGARTIADSLHNTVTVFAAPGKGAAIGSAILSSFALLSAYKHKAGVPIVDLGDSYVMAGVLYGSMLPFLFSALTMLSGQKVAGKLMDRARIQLPGIEGLLEGHSFINHGQLCVNTATKESLQEVILPAVIALMSPLTVGFLVGPTPLAGMLTGAIASGMMLAFMMSNAGGAWDNSKNYFETEEACDSKGTDTHNACIVGDSVGYLFKENSAPALSVFIKLMCLVALTIAPVIKGWENWQHFYYGFIPIVLCIATAHYVNRRVPKESGNIQIEIQEIMRNAMKR